MKVGLALQCRFLLVMLDRPLRALTEQVRYVLKLLPLLLSERPNCIFLHLLFVLLAQLQDILTLIEIKIFHDLLVHILTFFISRRNGHFTFAGRVFWLRLAGFFIRAGGTCVGAWSFLFRISHGLQYSI